MRETPVNIGICHTCSRLIRPRAILAAVALAAGCLSGCGAEQQQLMITLASTTTTRDTGLLDELLPAFEERTGIEVRPVIVGTGEALELGRRGDVDALLTHAPEAERQFVEDGYGIHRRPVMHNDFVLVGPSADPADVRGADSAAAALMRIAAAESTFVSRGDESGTHKKELALWSSAGIEPAGSWYVKAGSGMSTTLRIANEKSGYTLSDRGTFLAQGGSLVLAIRFDGDPALLNRYAVTLVNPDRHPHVRHDLARQFADFLVSPEAQTLIGRFGVERFGQPLFVPDADRGAATTP